MSDIDDHRLGNIARLRIPASRAERIKALPAPTPADYGWTAEDEARALADRIKVRTDLWLERVPAEYARASLIGVDETIAQQVAVWWRSDRQTLILRGSRGTGKTWIGYALGHKAVSEGLGAVVATPEEIAAAFDDRHGDPDLAKRLLQAHLLLLDELGGSDLPQWLAERLRLCIDKRVNNGLRQVVTTNLDAPAFEAWADANPKLASRLSLRQAAPIDVDRADRRSQQ